jgi:hypothetical protein
VKVEMDRPCRNRKFQEGVRREVCLWSPVDTVGLSRRNLVSILEEACDSYSPRHAPLVSTHTRSLAFKSLIVRIYGDVLEGGYFHNRVTELEVTRLTGRS